MGLIPFLLLAAAANEASRESSSYNNSSSHKSSGGDNVYYSFNYSYGDYVFREMEYGNSPELCDFIVKLFSYGEEIAAEYNAKVSSEYNEKLENKKNQFVSELTVLHQKERNLHDMNVPLIGKISNWSSNCGLDEYKCFVTFNGVDARDFETPDDDCSVNLQKTDECFQMRKKQLIDSMPKISELKLKRKQLLDEANILKKKQQRLFFREYHGRRLNEIQDELNEINDTLESMLSLSRKIEQYNNLDQHQKLVILDYVNQLRKVCGIESDYVSLFYKRPFIYSNLHLTIYHRPSNVDTNFWFKALSRMVEKEGIDFSYLDTVFKQIEAAPAKWIVRESDMYSCKLVEHYEKYKQVLNFFLHNIYFPEYSDVLTRHVQYTDIQEDMAKVKTNK